MTVNNSAYIKLESQQPTHRILYLTIMEVQSKLKSTLKYSKSKTL